MAAPRALRPLLGGDKTDGCQCQRKGKKRAYLQLWEGLVAKCRGGKGMRLAKLHAADHPCHRSDSVSLGAFNITKLWRLLLAFFHILQCAQF